MATFSGGITNAGLGLIDQQLTGAGQITLVNVKTGSGQPGGGGYEAQTALTTVVQTIVPDSSNALVNYQTTFRFTVDSSTVGSAYTLSEIGIFAQIGSGPVTLFAYYSANPGDSITATTGGSPILYEYAVVLGYNQATSVTVDVTLTTTVALHAATHLGAGTSSAGVDPIPIASQANTGSCPSTPNDPTQVVIGSSPAAFAPVPLATTAKQGGVPHTPNDPTQVPLGGNPIAWGPVPLVTTANKGGLPPTPAARNYFPVTSPTGSVSWMLGLPVIASNITLYVSTTGNDSTAQPNNASLPWAELQGALNYLSGYLILTGVTVTISIAAGVYNSTSTIEVNHPQGDQIQIIGTNGPSIAVTSTSNAAGVVGLAGAAGSFSGVNVGDYIAYVGSGGSFPSAQLISGVWKVTSASSSSIQFATAESLPSGYTNPTGGTVTPLKTVIIGALGQNGINVTGGGLGILSNICLVGQGSGSTPILGVDCFGSCNVSISTCGFYGWLDSPAENSAGIEASEGAIVAAVNCFGCRNSNGFLAENFSSSLSCTGCVSNSNLLHGFRSEGSQLSCSSCVSMANIGSGFAAHNSSYSIIIGCIAWYNQASGIDIEVMTEAVVEGTNFSSNGTDLSINILSCFNRANGAANSFTTKSANVTAYNVLTSDGCYISP